MIIYVIPWAIKYTIILASIAAIVAVVDIIMLVRERSTASLKGFLPAIDSILVIAGFMAVVGTCMAVFNSLNSIAGSNSLTNDSIIKAVVSAYTTALIAWILFFFFFEVWYVIRLLYRKSLKKLPASS